MMVTQTVQNKEKEHKQVSKDPGKEQNLAPFRPTAFAPFSGFDPMFRFRDEFNRLFNQFAPGSSNAEEFARRDHWGLDVHEDEQTMTIRAEAPGFEPDEFDVEVRDNQLIMCACHKAENEEKESGTHQWQRREFYHSMMLPSGVDAEKVDAEYHHGILSVKLPKTGETNSRHIQVKGKNGE